jgi:hypothetical protein
MKLAVVYYFSSLFAGKIHSPVTRIEAFSDRKYTSMEIQEGWERQRL